MASGSDVDVGVLASPPLAEPERTRLWLDLSAALGREVDLLVLSDETNPALAADVVSGRPVVGESGMDLLELVLRRSREAEDWERFILSFLRERRESRRYSPIDGETPLPLSPSQKDALVRRVESCRQEVEDLQAYQGLTLQQYRTDRSARRNVERIAETVATAVIDMAKTLVAASAGPVPQSYAEALRGVGDLRMVPGELAERLAGLATLRNALAHEYLDLKWPSIQQFIQTQHKDVLEFVARVEGLLLPPQPAQ